MDKPTYPELEHLYAQCISKADEYYKIFFEECHSIMLVVSPENGAILDANRAACGFYGYDKALLKQMTIGQINTLPPSEIQAAMRKVMGQERKAFIFQHRLADGQIKDVEVFSGPVMYEGQLALYSIIYDISERIQMQAQILREKQFSESLIHSLPGIMYMFDVRDRLVRWNQNFETVTGYLASEIQTMSPIDFIAPPDRDNVAQAVKEVYRSGQAHVEAALLTKTGHVIAHSFTGVRFISNQVSYLVGMGIDITQAKLAENQRLELIAQLQEALSQVKKLSGFLPICAACKKIRDDKGYWNQIEAYIRDRSEAEFSHSICPECARKLYPSMR
jgi:PAS domain S-box-containing protein